MLANIGVPGLILIIVLALIIFGPKRLPEMGKAVGQTLTEFKKSASNLTAEAKEPVEELKKTIQPIQETTQAIKETVDIVKQPVSETVKNIVMDEIKK